MRVGACDDPGYGQVALMRAHVATLRAHRLREHVAMRRVAVRPEARHAPGVRTMCEEPH